ncbi:hypothetical protein, partial [Xanthobacter flavus]
AGWIKPPPPVPWQGSDDQVQAALQAHAKAAMVVTNQLERPISAFEGEDLRSLTSALDAADTSGKVRILGALATLPPGVREATFGNRSVRDARSAVEPEFHCGPVPPPQQRIDPWKALALKRWHQNFPITDSP